MLFTFTTSGCIANVVVPSNDSELFEVHTDNIKINHSMPVNCYQLAEMHVFNAMAVFICGVVRKVEGTVRLPDTYLQFSHSEYKELEGKRKTSWVVVTT